MDFYGCSFTAGDELVDDIFFPWKKECTDVGEYYIKRSEEFNTAGVLDEYKKQNYMLAYPAQIEKLTGHTTFNHADNGAGLREMVYKIIHQVSTGDKPDHVFLQLPPTGREYVIDNIFPMTIQMSTINFVQQYARMEKYIREKVAVSTMYSWTVDDFMDLLMLDGFLDKRNIQYTLLDVGALDLRRKELIGLSRYEFLNKEIDKLKPVYLINQCEYKHLFGGHFDADTHKRFAEYIVSNVLPNTQSK